MSGRIDAALRRVGCGKKVLAAACRELVELEATAVNAQRRIKELRAWLEFHDTSDHKTEYSDLKLFRIHDGETHEVAARTAEEAVQTYAALCFGSLAEYLREYQDHEVSEIPPDVVIAVHDSDYGTITVKTAAEWADCLEPSCVSSTAF